MANKIYINGYFLYDNSRSGVYRFAYEILIHLDKQIDGLEVGFVLVVPSNTKNVPTLSNIKVMHYGPLINKHIWQQVILPYLVGDNFLVNLANFAPVFKRNQLCVIHDMLVFTYPECYSKQFVWLSKICDKLLIKYAKYIATVSNFSKYEILKYLGQGKSDIMVLPNAADHILDITQDDSVLQEYSLIGKKYILSVFSQKNPIYKNVGRYLDAIKQIDYQFVCVGQVNHNIDNLLSINYISDAKLKALYSNAQAVLCPSVYEGFGIVPMEALLCLSPIIVSDIEVFKEIYKDYAIFFNPYDVGDMVSKINAFIEDHAPHKSITSITNWYSWNRVTNILLNNILTCMP